MRPFASFRRAASALVALFLIGVVWGATAPAASAQSASSQPVDAASDIRQMLEDRDQQIKSILNQSSTVSGEKREELKTLINGVIDFRAMGQQALGSHWADLDSTQQAEFIDVFRDIVRAQSLADLEVYNSEVTYDEIDVAQDSAYVRTMTQYEGTRTPVVYILDKENGEWKAEDIIVDGVSTADGYARSFQTVIRKRGYEALMTSLRKKRDQVVQTS